MPPLDGRTALVTGGSRGIGRAVVQRLADDGAEVVLGYLERQEEAEGVVAAVAAAGGRAHAVRADLRVTADLRGMFDRAEALLGGLDIVVSSAAVMRHLSFADTTEEQYDDLMALNTRATFFILQEAVRRLRDGGRVVTISSTATVLAQPRQAVYSASKAAVEQLTRVAARTLGARGITVNAVSPGAVETEAVLAAASPETLSQWRRPTAFGRLGLPADVADVVAFLAGPDARWVTGQTLRAAGGAV